MTGREGTGSRFAGKVLRTVGFVLFQLLTILVLVEAALRGIRPFYKKLDTLLYYASVQTEYDEIESTEKLLKTSILGFRPGYISFGFALNSRSFRTPEYVGPRRPGVLRIMAVGDSFTFDSGGLRYHKLWVPQLERLLNLEGHPAEVFSVGVPGVGPNFELRLWELEHQVVRPDLVVVAVFVGNDFTDERDQQLTRGAETAARYFVSYRLVRNLTRLRQEKVVAEEALNALSDGAGRLRRGVDVDPSSDEDFSKSTSRERYLNIEWNRMRICWSERREVFEELASGVTEVLKRFDVEVRASGSEFVVMVIPDDYQVNKELQRDIFERFKIRPDSVDLDLPQSRLAAYFEEEGIDYLDLLPVFRRQAEHETLYTPRNTHWNPRGNALAAQTLAAYLVERF